jgi:RimJ/RimL family protein N-acetyltransferase
MRPHLTRELSENERPSLLTHFVALDQESRRLRFGSGGFSSDESLRAYVKRIDFKRDAVFGVLDADLCLIGVAHLAREEYAELGISVLPSHRGQGIAAALLERAHTYARNRNISVLLMHCLAENEAMIHLASKQGMQVETGGGASSACVELQPASLSTIASELLMQRVDLFYFALRSNVLAVQQAITGQPPQRN